MAESKTKYAGKTIKVEQVASPARRHWEQRATLKGLGLNKIRLQSDVPETAANPTISTAKISRETPLSAGRDWLL